jgi:UPF0176 protein
MNQYPICVANFYKFVQLSDLDQLRAEIDAKMAELDVRGTILLSKEGINANIGGSPQTITEFENYLHARAEFSDIEFKKSYGMTVPFSRRRVKLKDSILCFDDRTQFEVPEFSGTKRLNPQQWAEMLDNKDDDVVLLDTRNDYEYAYGSFEGAEQLNIRHFREFQDQFLERYKGQENKKFLVFCTGGIRCEKVTAFAEKNGFNNCYQLDSGVIGYFKEQGAKHWNGSCFVFDFRWSVTPDLVESGEGHYLEDGFRGSVHVAPDQSKKAAWPVRAQENA